MTTEKPKRKSYTARPSVEPEVMQRLAVISRLMCGEINVTEAAAELGLSRNHFQTIYHRSLGAMIEELTPKTAGRPSKDPFVAALEDEAISLRAEVKRLASQLEVSQRATMGLAEIVREQSSIGRARSTRTKPQKKAAEKTSDDDDDRRGLLAQARNLVSVGVPAPVAARAVATPATTLRRWAARDRAGEQLARRRGPRIGPLPSEGAVALGEARVRKVRGHIGCAALGKAVGLSRRTALLVKERTLIAMERERKATAARVSFTTPGVVRGFDQMYVATLSGWRFALISADAAVPYRTSATVADRYLGDDVMHALENDIERNGAPLVWRLDRAAAHRTPEVTEMLEHNGVLVLHGPPHCPRYYGQLERQNREHRAWLDDLELRGTSDLQVELAEMFRCLNDLIPRRSLGWCTPSQLWTQRPALEVDRDGFREEVKERSARIAPSLGERERRLGFDQRFAIEQTLKRHGMMEINSEGQC